MSKGLTPEQLRAMVVDFENKKAEQEKMRMEGIMCSVYKALEERAKNGGMCWNLNLLRPVAYNDIITKLDYNIIRDRLKKQGFVIEGVFVSWGKK